MATWISRTNMVNRNLPLLANSFVIFHCAAADSSCRNRLPNGPVDHTWNKRRHFAPSFSFFVVDSVLEQDAGLPLRGHHRLARTAATRIPLAHNSNPSNAPKTPLVYRHPTMYVGMKRWKTGGSRNTKVRNKREKFCRRIQNEWMHLGMLTLCERTDV